jgi:hypothetical protein
MKTGWVRTLAVTSNTGLLTRFGMVGAKTDSPEHASLLGKGVMARRFQTFKRSKDAHVADRAKPCSSRFAVLTPAVGTVAPAAADKASSANECGSTPDKHAA